MADTTPWRMPVEERLPKRAVAGVGGWAGGAFVGAAAGVGVSALASPCDCEYGGLTEAVFGGLLGGAAGAALTAAAPRYGSECRYGTRFWRGFLGSAGGSAIGWIAGGGWDHEAVLFTVPVGAIAGAAIGSDCS